jgi:hypothetical protein
VLVVEATGIRDVPSGPAAPHRPRPLRRRACAPRRGRARGERRRTLLFIQLIDFLAIRGGPSPRSYFARFLRSRRPPRGVSPASAPRRRRGRPRARDASPRCDDARCVLSRRASSRPGAFGARERVTDLHLPHVAELPRVLPGLFADAAAARAGRRLRRRRAALRARLHDGVVPVADQHAPRRLRRLARENRLRCRSR